MISAALRRVKRPGGVQSRTDGRASTCEHQRMTHPLLPKSAAGSVTSRKTRPGQRSGTARRQVLLSVVPHTLGADPRGNRGRRRVAMRQVRPAAGTLRGWQHWRTTRCGSSKHDRRVGSQDAGAASIREDEGRPREREEAVVVH